MESRPKLWQIRAVAWGMMVSRPSCVCVGVGVCVCVGGCGWMCVCVCVCVCVCERERERKERDWGQDGEPPNVCVRERECVGVCV